MKTINDFFDFIKERHNIYVKKELLNDPPPWTQDKILEVFSFCNVKRFWDKGTQYLYNRVITNSHLSEENIFFNTVVYRFFNRYKLFDGEVWDDLLYLETFDPDKESEYLENLKKSIFSTAYTISQSVWNPKASITLGKWGKHVQVLYALEELKLNMDKWWLEIKNAETPEKELAIIMRIPLVGWFLAGQILLDLSYGGKLVKATNDNFLVVGPGASAGLKWMFECKNYQEECDKTRELRKLVGDYLPFDLSLMDIQNCLCEFNKYCKFSNGQGKKRYYQYEVK